MAVQVSQTGADWKELRSAIETGDLSLLEKILKDGSVINSADASGATPLLHAVRCNRLAAVRSLIEHGANVNAVRADGFTALLLASFFGYNDILHVLLESGANVNAKTRFGTCAQTWAAVRGLTETAQLLQQQPDERRKATASSSRNDPEHSHKQDELRPKPSQTIFKPSTTASDSAEIRVITSEITQRSTTPVIVRTLKDPPEIWDLVHESQIAFHSGSAFSSRLMSSRPKTIALALTVILVVAVVTFFGLSSRTKGNRPVAGIAAPISSGATQSEPPKNVTLATEPPVVNDQATQPVQPKLKPAQTESSNSHSFARAQPAVRRPQVSTNRDSKRANEPTSTAEDVEKTTHSRTLRAVEPETRVTENSLPTTKPTDVTTNSQLITRPFGSRVKPKTIQWP